MCGPQPFPQLRLSRCRQSDPESLAQLYSSVCSLVNKSAGDGSTDEGVIMAARRRGHAAKGQWQ